MSVLSDVNAQKSDDYFRSIGFDKGRQGAMDWLHEQRQAQGGLTLEEKQRFATEANMRAIQPAVSSLEAGIPELRAAFMTRQSQLEAEKQPLKDRYEQLLNEIRGREQSQVNEATEIANREFGRRGIPLSSTFVAEEIFGRTQPIRSAAQSDILSTIFEREANLRNLDNAITNLTSEMVEAERNIRNSIAQIQATAGSTGVAQALEMFKFAQEQRQKELDRLLTERELNASIEVAKRADTEIVTVDGRKKLINKQTGEVISDLGSSSEGGTGGTGGIVIGGTKSSTQTNKADEWEPITQSSTQYSLGGINLPGTSSGNLTQTTGTGVTNLWEQLGFLPSSKIKTSTLKF